MQETRSLYLHKHGQDSQKTIFQGVVPPDLPPSGPFRGSDPMCEFNIFKLHENEDLCKKTRGLYPQKHGQDSQKTIFQGVVPPDLPPSGGLTLNCF